MGMSLQTCIIGFFILMAAWLFTGCVTEGGFQEKYAYQANEEFSGVDGAEDKELDLPDDPPPPPKKKHTKKNVSQK